MSEADVAIADSAHPFEADRNLRRVLEVVGWVLVAAMLGTGLISVFTRMFFMGEATGTPADTYDAFNVRYVLNPLVTWLHLLPALCIAATGPLQFIRRVRNKKRQLHRVSGRIYLTCGVIGAFSGLYLGAVHPFSGWQGPGANEGFATIFFASFTLFCLVKAYTTVRRRQFAAHREWVIRSWALMLGIGTERILLGVMLTVTEIDIAVLFGLTFWMAAAINIPVPSNPAMTVGLADHSHPKSGKATRQIPPNCRN